MEYLVVGGLAVNLHGFVRLTRDVDLVIRLTPENAAKGLHALLNIGYQMQIPERPEAFANAATRERWRQEKNMIVLKLWSDEHRRTPVDVFVYEPFSFEVELPRATGARTMTSSDQPIAPDWKWGTSEGSREFDRLTDRRLSCREILEWLEEAETLSLRFQTAREKAAVRGGAPLEAPSDLV